MDFLETKVPPPVVTLLLAVAMWAVSRVTPGFGMPAGASSVAALAFFVAGVIVIAAGACRSSVPGPR
ncbi:MAG: hypothetical protein Q7W30_07920 [Coriobacteriia bacterium]|nr:hypothetical protein [Coriobacteriia bacterium]